jgi:hypothetical protein
MNGSFVERRGYSEDYQPTLEYQYPTARSRTPLHNQYGSSNMMVAADHDYSYEQED